MKIYQTETLTEDEQAALAESQQSFSAGASGEQATPTPSPEENTEGTVDGTSEEQTTPTPTPAPEIQYDPETGYPIDPTTGLVLDPQTGQPIDTTITDLQGL